MKRFDLTKITPPGTDVFIEIKRFCIALFCATCCSIQIYGISLHRTYDYTLFEYVGTERVLSPNAVMPPFPDILGRSLWFYYFVALCSLSIIILYFMQYYRGSKSIYLMRRLPQRWELLRRSITLPVLGALISLLTAFLMMLLFLAAYYLVTPEQCLPSNPWI